MVKITSLLIKAGSGVGFSFGVRAQTEMEIWCVKGMYRLKVVSNENNLGFMGSLKCQRCAMHIYTIIMHNRAKSQDNGSV